MGEYGWEYGSIGGNMVGVREYGSMGGSMGVWEYGWKYGWEYWSMGVWVGISEYVWYVSCILGRKGEKRSSNYCICNLPTNPFRAGIFSDIGCHTLFLPATQRDLLMDLSRVQEEDLTPEYREERDALRKELMEKIEPKEKNGKLVWICLTFCSNKILLSTYVFICLFDIM